MNSIHFVRRRYSLGRSEGRECRCDHSGGNQSKLGNVRLA